MPSVSMPEWGAVLAASVLCVTLPSRGPVLSVPREPQPKLQGAGGEVRLNGPGRAGRLLGLRPLVSGWVFPGTWKASVASPRPSRCRQPFCFPDALCLGTLPQNMQYVWVTAPTPHPHPGQLLDPKGCGCHGLLLAPPANLSSH